MDNKALYDAAREGNTFKLQALLAKDPLLLDKVMEIFTETPLHTAALAGHSEFVKQLLRLAPWLASYQSSRKGLNALHMAAAKGHVDVVTAFLDFNQDLDLSFDGEGCGPLHYAAYHGRSEVVKVMVSRNISLMKQVNFAGETALHLAVKSNRYEVMRVMEEMLKNEGNDEDCEIVLMHVKDESGYSVANLLVASSYKGNNLFQAYVSKVRGSDNQGNNNNNQLASTSTKVPSDSEESDSDFEAQAFYRQAILVIMVLIATVTFQALISPPQFLWRDGGLKPLLFVDPQQTKWAYQFLDFLVANTAAFLMSCWGLFAVLCREDLHMIFFWLGASVTSILISYLYVLLPMMQGSVKYMFLKKLLIFLSIGMFLSVVRYSNTYKKICTKLKKFWRRFVLRRTETTSNRENTNAMVAMSSTTSGNNNAQV